MKAFIQVFSATMIAVTANVAAGSPSFAPPDTSLTTETKPVLIDPAFNPRLAQSENPGVDFVSVQSDGKIFLYGNFDTVNGIPSPAIARLNPDGSLDPTIIEPPLLAPLPKEVAAGWSRNPASGYAWLEFIPLSDGKFLITNPFKDNWGQFVGLARLNSDGTFDTSFQRMDSGLVRSVALQPDGKILVGSRVDELVPGRLIRLNGDGTLDPTFVLPIPEAQSNRLYRIDGLALQPDGKVIVFEASGGLDIPPWWRLSRRNPDGTLDSTFQAPARFSGQRNYSARPTIQTILLDQHRNVLLIGRFPRPDGLVDWVIRLKPDGSVDDSFQISIGGGDSYLPVTSAALEPDGNLILGGSFRFVNGVPRTGLVRLLDKSPPGLKTFAWTKPAIVVAENAGAVEVEIERLGEISAAATIEYATRGGTAQAGWDFEVKQGVLAFRPGEQARRLRIPLHDNRSPAPDRAFFVDLANASEGSIVASTVAITIMDQDRPGSLDLSFDDARYLSDGFYLMDRHVLAVQPDGSILVQNVEWNPDAVSEDNPDELPGGYVYRVQRLMQDGTLDPQFHLSGLTEHYLKPPILIQSDGKLVLQADGMIQRLNKDGSPDDTFSVLRDNIGLLALDSSGQILVGGENFVGGNNLMRLKSDGVPDPSFNPKIRILSLNHVLAQSDGRILIAGNFIGVDGKALPKIVRLESNGDLDRKFVANGPVINELLSATGYINSVLLQTDGKILVAGGIRATPPVAATSRVVRLDSNGTVDETFAAPRFDNFAEIAIQPNGRIIVGGAAGMRRLNSDGSLDSDFSLGSASIPYSVTPVLDAFNGKVLFSNWPVLLLPDGSLRTGIFRLNLGSDAPNFQSVRRNSSETELRLTALPGQLYTLEWSADLATWNPLATNGPASSYLDFVDPETAASRRFYRVRSMGEK